MARYRKKPVEIEAFKWTGGPDQTEDPEWCIEAIQQGKIEFHTINGVTVAHIHTLEGIMQANPGDYIVKGTHEEFYPVKPEIFEANNELISF